MCFRMRRRIRECGAGHECERECCDTEQRFDEIHGARKEWVDVALYRDLAASKTRRASHQQRVQGNEADSVAARRRLGAKGCAGWSLEHGARSQKLEMRFRTNP